jgi:replicative DNA helicase
VRELRPIEPRSVAGRTPPHDLEAQEALLGTLLKAPESIDLVVDALKAEHFFGEPDQRVYQGLVELHRMGKPVDVSALASWLLERNLMNVVGGKARLATLLCVGDVRSCEANARRVTLKWRLRRMIAECQLIEAEGYGALDDVRQFLEDGPARLAPYAEEPDDGGAVSVSEALHEVFTQIQSAAASGEAMFGIPTGLRHYDEKTAGLKDGETTIVAARPGMGKTSLAMQWAVAATEKINRVTARDGQTVEIGSTALVFSMEMPRSQLVTRLLCTYGRVDSKLIEHGRLQGLHWQRLTEAAAWLSRKSLFIDDSPGLSPLQIRAKVRRVKSRLEQLGAPPLRLVVIDYLQLMNARSLVAKGANREQEISACSRFVKGLAKEMGIPVVCLSQLSRDVEKRSDKRPQLSDLRESGAIEQDADNVVFIYRDEYYLKDKTPADVRGVAELIIAKQRGGQMGGTVKVRFFDSCTRFDDLEGGGYEP